MLFRSFVHGDGTIFFVGDSAHGVSPFGARGANSAVQDADNLGWKLASAVLNNELSDKTRKAQIKTLLSSYGTERQFAADENILNSTRATDFITPKSEMSRIFRNATLSLAKNCPFARRMVNSGRLSVPAVLPFAPVVDCKVQTSHGVVYLLAETARLCMQNGGLGYVLWVYAAELNEAQIQAAQLSLSMTLTVMRIDEVELEHNLFKQRYAASVGQVWLIRTDQHIVGSWQQIEAVYDIKS